MPTITPELRSSFEKHRDDCYQNSFEDVLSFVAEREALARAELLRAMKQYTHLGEAYLDGLEAFEEDQAGRNRQPLTQTSNTDL